MAATTLGAAAVVGAGLWLGAGQQPGPIPAAPESAVVVSSLACADGAGGTIVDVLEPAGAPGSGPLRADLDACGYREGQQLLVQFVPDDRTQVVLAGNESATDFLTGDRLPVALALAGLLALGGVVAIWVDGRRSRAGSGVRSPRDALWRSVFNGNAGRHSDAQPGAFADDGAEPRRAAAHQAVDPDEVIDPARELVNANRLTEPHRSLTSVDLTFPFSSNLAACLHDELFTHRTRSS